MWFFFVVVAICMTIIALVTITKDAAEPKQTSDYYDDETLRKVYDALRLCCQLDEQQAIDAINMMQNAGILFRERR